MQVRTPKPNELDRTDSNVRQMADLHRTFSSSTTKLFAHYPHKVSAGNSTFTMSDLEIFSPFTIGGQELRNRVVLAPMTRAR
jgi:hypothetical protein